MVWRPAPPLLRAAPHGAARRRNNRAWRRPGHGGCPGLRHRPRRAGRNQRAPHGPDLPGRADPCEDRELGDSVLARALGGEVRPIDRWDLVADAFGARRLDPRLTGRQFRWLAEALLDAQPAPGGAASPARFCRSTPRFSGLRPCASAGAARTTARRRGAAGLEPGRDPGGPVPFAAAGGTGRPGRLAGSVSRPGRAGRVPAAADGQVTDAIPFGLVVAEFCAKAGDGAGGGSGTGSGRAALPWRSAPTEASLRIFGEAAESLTLRWSENGHALDAQAMCDRAEQILVELGAGDLAAES